MVKFKKIFKNGKIPKGRFFIVDILTCTNYETSRFLRVFLCVNLCQIRICDLLHLFI